MEEMVMSGELYYKKFVEFYGIIGEHWKNDTWASREKALRHNMVCVLLCNMTLKKRGAEVDLSNEPSCSKRQKTLWDEDFDDLAEEEMEIDDPSILTDDGRYRFLCLEGQPSTTVSLIQNKYAKLWGIPSPGKKWDIIDKELNCFVEVKISSNYKKCVEDFKNYTITMENHASLVVIHPVTFSVQNFGTMIDFRGMCKAQDFLSRREIYMRQKKLIRERI